MHSNELAVLLNNTVRMSRPEGLAAALAEWDRRHGAPLREEHGVRSSHGTKAEADQSLSACPLPSTGERRIRKPSTPTMVHGARPLPQAGEGSKSGPCDWDSSRAICGNTQSGS